MVFLTLFLPDAVDNCGMGAEGMTRGNDAEKMNGEEVTPLEAGGPGKELLSKGSNTIEAALEALE